MTSLSKIFKQISVKEGILIAAQLCLVYKLIKSFNSSILETKQLQSIIHTISSTINNEATQIQGNLEEKEISEEKTFQEPIIAERKQAEKEDADFFKICITGGPCGGKTTGLVYVQEKMRQLGYQVFVVPEAATIIFSGGGMLDMTNYTKAQGIAFQTNLLKLQIRLENSMSAIAKINKKKSIILCDRGLMDGSAYVDHKDWEDLLKANNINEVLMRDDRYDLVIHLVSAAVGAEKFYNQQNQARLESTNQAAEMDRKTQLAWLGHPNHKIIDNSGKNFEEKLQRVLHEVKQCVGIETYAQKFTKKFLIKPLMNLNAEFEGRLQAQRFYIEDVFLAEDDQNKSCLKLRRRGQDQNYAYILSSIKVDKISSAEQNREIQYKKILSYREYIFMLGRADPKRNNLISIRYVFLHKGNMFIVDTYLNVKEGFSILKVVLKNENQTFSIPPQFQVLKEITEDLGYKRSTISKKNWYFSKDDAKLIQQSLRIH